MIKRLAAISAILMLASGAAFAGGFRTGLEWGSSTLLVHGYHYNYFTAERYRINEEGSRFVPHFNAYVNAYAGANVSDNLSAAACIGFSGLEEGKRIFPVFLRTSWHPKGVDNDGLYFTIDIGSCMERAGTTLIGAVGTAYRIAALSWLDIDFLLNFRFLSTSPDIFDPDTGEKIKAEDIRVSSASYYSINFGIAVNF